MLKFTAFFFCFIVHLTHVFGQKPMIGKDYIVKYEFLTVEEGLPSRDIYCVAEDKKGFIWFGSKNGLCRFDGKNYKYFTTKNGLESNIVVNLYVDNQNRIFIAYGDKWTLKYINNDYGLLDANTFEINSYNKFFQTKSKPKLPSHFLRSYLYQNNLKSLNKQTNSFIKIQGEKLEKIEHEKIFSFETKNTIVKSEKGIFYIENNRIYKILENAFFGSDANYRIWHFLKDTRGYLWVCTQKGVYKIRIKPNYFQTFFTIDQQTLVKHPQARGIYVANMHESKTIHANLLSYSFKSGSHSGLIDIFQLGWGIIGLKDQFYISDSNNMYIFQSKTLSLIKKVPFLNNRHGSVNCMFQKDASSLFLGRSSDILLFDIKNNRYNSISYKSLNLPKVKNVYRIFNSSKGILAQAENGLFLIQYQQIVDYFGPLAKDKNKHLPIEYMLDAHEDKNHDLWIATNGQGLFKWEWNKPYGKAKIENYTNEKGLPSMVLYRIEEDENNHLWIGSDDGLIRFYKSNGESDLFTIKDGLSNDEFNRGSSFKALDGFLYFGGINGVNGFNPNEIPTRTFKEVPLHLISLIKYSAEGEQDELISFLNNRRIEFYNSDKLLKIDFTLLDYSVQRKKYAYRIKGVQNSWISVTNGSISLGELPFGEYTIEIKAQIENESWQKHILEIPILVIPPFYLTSWFIILSISVILLLIIGIFLFRSKRLKAQNAKLEKIIINRTEDLQKALGDKDILLKELHHRVKNNLQIVTGLLDLQKARMTDKKAIEALNEGKIRLSSIVLIHQNFYRGTNLETISFKVFLTDLVIAVKQLFENEQRIIDCVIQSDDIPIDINIAIPLGLIVNELLTNSYKYLPPEQSDKKIEINLTILENGNYEFKYRDNGPGLPPTIDFENAQTLGLRLISGLSEQINGNLEYRFEEGSVFVIQFNPELSK
jgi:two-component sensor histidine kinase/ligand-binding sensor domain-containing protein